MRVASQSGAVVKARGHLAPETPGAFLPAVSEFWRDWFGAHVPLVTTSTAGLSAVS